MHPKQAFLSAISLVLVISSSVQSKGDNQISQFTIQVAAFVNIDDALVFVERLSRAGESPVWGEVDVPGRGRWVRIFIGVFDTFIEARRYAERLVSRALIQEFLVRPSGEMKLLMRPRSIGPDEDAAEFDDSSFVETPLQSADAISVAFEVSLSRYSTNVASPLSLSSNRTPPLPIARPLRLEAIPHSNTNLIPRSDPVKTAFRIVANNANAKRNVWCSKGGLWLSGDIAEGLSRLRWILGPDQARLLLIDNEGRLSIDTNILAKLAGADSLDTSVASPVIANYISLNEGLLLLVQLTEGAARYCLHIGSEAPTFAGKARVSGSINLDNNYDSRINPYRARHAKLDQERPPARFDALVALNPSARWFNLRTDRFVSVAQITFHELAEAYAKVALGLEYLPGSEREGAHNQALEREERLREQRPSDNVVTTLGPNRVLRTEEELRQFYTSGSQR